MRLLILGGLLAVTAACGAYHIGPAAQTGNVSGTVVVFPCAPVEQPQAQPKVQPCKFAFGTGLQIVFTDGSTTASATVDSKGKYSIDLAAGTWNVSFKGIARSISGPKTVTVPAGGSVVADYQVDSGIRMPPGPATAAP